MSIDEAISLKELQKNILDKDLYLKTIQEGITEKELNERSKKIGIDTEKIIDVLNLRNKEGIFEEEIKGGLKIGEIVFHKLSGPSSFIILTPKEKKFKNTIRPLIFLIGDIHGKINGLCENCRCIDKDNCCMYSFDSTFIQLLDRLTNRQNPIGIYVEEFKITKPLDIHRILELEQQLEKKIIENKEELFNDKIRVGEQLLEFKLNYSDCFRTLKNKMENKCPTNYIQWNYTDTRQAIFSKENQLFLYLNNKNKYFDFLADLKPILDNLFFFDITNFIKKLFSDRKSIIGKQINRSKLKLNNEIDKYITPYFNYIITRPCDVYNKKKEIVQIVLNKEIIKKLRSFYYDNKDISSEKISDDILLINENIGSIITLLTSPLVEIYSYYRMIKQLNNIDPQSNIQSYPLIINILGDNHIQNYQYFLTQIKKEYNIYWSSTTKDDCITFNNLNLDLNKFFPKEVKYIEKNAHFKAIDNFRQYLLGNIYKEILKNQTIPSESNLQTRVIIINRKRPELNMTLEKLKDLTEFEILIKEIEIDKKTSIKEIDESLLKFSNSNNLKYAMENNNINITKKILEQPQIEFDEKDLYTTIDDFIMHNYIYPKGNEDPIITYLETSEELQKIIDSIKPRDEYIKAKRIEIEEIILDILKLYYKKSGLKDYENQAKFHLYNETFYADRL